MIQIVLLHHQHQLRKLHMYKDVFHLLVFVDQFQLVQQKRRRKLMKMPKINNENNNKINHRIFTNRHNRSKN